MTRGLEAQELSKIYKDEKALVAKKGKDALEAWFVENRRKLEEREGAIVFDTMTASTRSKMMVKTALQMSETVLFQLFLSPFVY